MAKDKATTGKKPSGTAQTGGVLPLDTGSQAPNISHPGMHSEHKEAFTALLGLAAKPLNKPG